MTTGELVGEPLVGRWKRTVSVLKRAPLIPLIIISIIVLVALLANFISPHLPTAVSLPDRLLPPFWVEGGDMVYPLGTDHLGRDILVRMMYGARVSLYIAALALVLGGGFGTIVGLISGFFGGRVDAVIMRAADAALAFPMILLALLLAVILGPSLNNVVIAISVLLWARYARVIRGEVLGLKEQDFIAQARITGCSTSHIILRHLFPNVVPTLLVMLTLQVGWVILVEASLSFLGAGVPPPTPAWGSMVAQGREFLNTAWWVSLIPGVAILLTVLSFNIFGDWLRDTLDPRLRQV